MADTASPPHSFGDQLRKLRNRIVSFVGIVAQEGVGLIVGILAFAILSVVRMIVSLGDLAIFGSKSPKESLAIIAVVLGAHSFIIITVYMSYYHLNATDYFTAADILLYGVSLENIILYFGWVLIGTLLLSILFSAGENPLHRFTAQYWTADFSSRRVLLAILIPLPLVAALLFGYRGWYPFPGRGTPYLGICTKDRSSEPITLRYIAQTSGFSIGLVEGTNQTEGPVVVVPRSEIAAQARAWTVSGFSDAKTQLATSLALICPKATTVTGGQCGESCSAPLAQIYVELTELHKNLRSFTTDPFSSPWFKTLHENINVIKTNSDEMRKVADGLAGDSAGVPWLRVLLENVEAIRVSTDGTHRIASSFNKNSPDIQWLARLLSDTDAIKANSGTALAIVENFSSDRPSVVWLKGLTENIDTMKTASNRLLEIADTFHADPPQIAWINLLLNRIKAIEATGGEMLGIAKDFHSDPPNVPWLQAILNDIKKIEVTGTGNSTPPLLQRCNRYGPIKDSNGKPLRIQFELNSSEYLGSKFSNQQNLDRIIERISRRPTDKRALLQDYVVVAGMADSIGSPLRNFTLSKERAREVAKEIGKRIPGLVPDPSCVGEQCYRYLKILPLGEGQDALNSDPDDISNRSVIVYDCAADDSP